MFCLEILFRGKRTRHLAAALAVVLALIPAAESLGGQALNEPLRGIARVTDPRGWLNPEDRAALEDRLAAFWSRTGLKVSVLVAAHRDEGESLEAYANQTAETWGLAGTPGGVLLVADPEQRRAALSVAPRLMADVPEGAIARIIDGNVNPMLRRGELAGGIREGVERIAAFLENPSRLNTSLFARGYGTLAAFGLFLAGVMARPRFGPVKAGAGAALLFGTLVCFDGFGLGFHWAGVLFCAALSAGFLGLFVWIGTGSDIPKR
ncbi:MAG: TPM domain-containing protein [Sulfuricella sp.]|nr:TPM domain-containing protein [Sulfuricella sp.]